MNAKDVLKGSLKTADMVFNGLLDDLSDADLLVRTSPGANHLAWQLGHLIASERMMTEGISPGTCPELPEGFAESHSRDTCSSDDASQFCSKDVYLAVYRKQREATLKVIDVLPESDLTNESPEFIRKAAPTVASLLTLQALHQMWHVGQITALRRQLKKPVVF